MRCAALAGRTALSRRVQLHAVIAVVPTVRRFQSGPILPDSHVSYRQTPARWPADLVARRACRVRADFDRYVSHEPSDAARVLSMLAIVTSIGPLLAPLIGGQLLLLGGWRVVFVALTTFGAVCAVTAFLRVPETWPREKRASSAVLQSFAAYGKLLRDPVAWGHMLCGGMAFASMFAYITATPFVYIKYFHVSAQHYGFLFGLNIVGIMFGNFMNTRLVGQLGPLPIISAAAMVSCVASLFVALVCLTGWGGLWSIVAGLFFVVGVVGVLSA